MPPALQRELGVVPLELDADGTLHVAGARPDVDLARLGHPARLSLARADEVERLLPPPPRTKGDPGTDAVRVSPVEAPPAPEAPPSPPRPRRARRRALAALAALALAAAALALVLARDDRPTPAPDLALVEERLPAGLPPDLPGPLRSAGRAAALEAVCGGTAIAAVVTAPARPGEGGCGLAAVAEATVSATVLLGSRPGCVDLRRARELAARSAPGQAREGAQPLSVRPVPGAPCVAAVARALRDASYPLSEAAVLLARPRPPDRARVQALAEALRAAETGAPVTQLVLPDARR